MKERTYIVKQNEVTSFYAGAWIDEFNSTENTAKFKMQILSDKPHLISERNNCSWFCSSATKEKAFDKISISTYGKKQKGFLGYPIIIDEDEETMRFGTYELQNILVPVKKTEEMLEIEDEILEYKFKIDKLENRLHELKKKRKEKNLQ